MCTVYCISWGGGGFFFSLTQFFFVEFEVRSTGWSLGPDRRPGGQPRKVYPPERKTLDVSWSLASHRASSRGVLGSP